MSTYLLGVEDMAMDILEVLDSAATDAERLARLRRIAVESLAVDEAGCSVRSVR